MFRRVFPSFSPSPAQGPQGPQGMGEPGRGPTARPPFRPARPVA
jgi:hypothetical protein